MEQKTIGWLFFAETFLMGAISIALGIALGVLCSQFMSAMLLASYGHSYELTWTLFPDTVLWTVGFFTISFFVVGLFNVRTIRKIKIIDMLSADRQNEPDLKKNRFIPTILVIYLVLSIWMLETGIQKMIFFFDPRFAFPLHIPGIEKRLEAIPEQWEMAAGIAVRSAAPGKSNDGCYSKGVGHCQFADWIYSDFILRIVFKHYFYHPILLGSCI